MHDSVLGKHLEPIASAASVSLWNRPPTMGLLCYGPLRRLRRLPRGVDRQLWASCVMGPLRRLRRLPRGVDRRLRMGFMVSYGHFVLRMCIL